MTVFGPKNLQRLIPRTAISDDPRLYVARLSEEEEGRDDGGSGAI